MICIMMNGRRGGEDSVGKNTPVLLQKGDEKWTEAIIINCCF